MSLVLPARALTRALEFLRPGEYAKSADFLLDYWIKSEACRDAWSYKAAMAARYGQTETLKAIVAMGGKWTTFRLRKWKWEPIYSPQPGLAGMVQMFKPRIVYYGAHTGFSYQDRCEDVADSAAEHGHLETLKWIRAQGGHWSYHGLDMARRHGHRHVVRWIMANGGDKLTPPPKRTTANVLVVEEAAFVEDVGWIEELLTESDTNSDDLPDLEEI